MNLPFENLNRIAVEISGISHHYGKISALDHITISLLRGETLGLIGPDGVGKSTLLSLISGIKSIQIGSISVLGANLKNKLDRERIQPKIAYMPQGLGRKLYPALSVYENVEFAARLFDLPLETRDLKIYELLAATGLDTFHNRLASQLSGGMKQKLALCCSLVQDPELLILDEPTTGIDPLSRRQFWELIDRIKSSKKILTIIIATSNMQEAERFDNIAALDFGKLLIAEKKERVLDLTASKTLEESYIALLPERRLIKETSVSNSLSSLDDQPTILVATNLTKKFGEFVAVNNVSFHIKRGEIFGFLGPNGCGKTTTIKMLTGILQPTSGSSRFLDEDLVFGRAISYLKVGYMSQNFSLYEELTVKENLWLHANLCIEAHRQEKFLAVQRALTTFDLQDQSEFLPRNIPIGIRQRLQLAVACLHKPKILVLDEPTSGVDPRARELFWQHIYRLSREDKVTIFITTHFMNEAEKCDRVSLMHHGEILCIGPPKEISSSRNTDNLEAAFISFLEVTHADQVLTNTQTIPSRNRIDRFVPGINNLWFNLPRPLSLHLSRLLAVTRREFVELLRDKNRISLAVIGPIILFAVAAVCVSFDLKEIHYAIIDHDQSNLSRELLENFRGNPYLIEDKIDPKNTNLIMPINHKNELIIEIPENYGRDIGRNRQPEIGIFIDGSTPLTAISISALTNGIIYKYQNSMKAMSSISLQGNPIAIETRYAFNQEFKSIQALASGALMLALFLYPTMMTALGIVREKEIGSILNFYSSPCSVEEFLIGKQVPYIALAIINYFTLIFIAVFILGIHVKGSILGLSLGALVFIFASTSFGILISTIVKSQVSAIFGAALICLILAVNFSGFLFPVSMLPRMAYFAAIVLPSTWFQFISVGCISKGMVISDLITMFLTIILIGIVNLFSARFLLKKQEK